MRLWVTEINAIDPVSPDRGIVTYGGPNVPGITQRDAEQYCQDNGLGYCRVIGELIAEIPCKQNSHEPDFVNTVNYDNLN